MSRCAIHRANFSACRLTSNKFKICRIRGDAVMVRLGDITTYVNGFAFNPSDLTMDSMLSFLPSVMATLSVSQFVAM
jgi:hypothetical protein